MIVSASRRTDIPAFYSRWFIGRVTEGYLFTRNPMNWSQITEVSLSRESVDCFVFWTKDPANVLEDLAVLNEIGHRYYFQFTLTPYGNDVERNLREKQAIRETFFELSRRIGKHRVLWRYDPVILNDRYTVAYHASAFEEMCDSLRGYTEVCTISFVDLYPKLKSAIDAKLIREISESEAIQIASAFSRIAGGRGIEVRDCADRYDLREYGIRPASCIDRATAERICGYRITAGPDRSQRRYCNCIQSVDIGAYDTCLHGCAYCYANQSPAVIAGNRARHDPKSDILLGPRIRSRG